MREADYLRLVLSVADLVQEMQAILSCGFGRFPKLEIELLQAGGLALHREKLGQMSKLWNEK